jgi:hypothetical protein
VPQHSDSAPAAPPYQRRNRFYQRAVAAVPPLLCLLAAVVCILALTWPWCRHFDGHFLDHWDPPFHAWKLEVMARKILGGDFLFRNRDTTLFYPIPARFTTRRSPGRPPSRPPR